MARSVAVMNSRASLTKTVEVAEWYLHSLERDALRLNALFAAGVDNWDYYDDAMEAAEEAIAESPYAQ